MMAQADNVAEGKRVAAFAVLSGVICLANVCGTLAAGFLSISHIFQVFPPSNLISFLSKFRHNIYTNCRLHQFLQFLQQFIWGCSSRTEFARRMVLSRWSTQKPVNHKKWTSFIKSLRLKTCFACSRAGNDIHCSCKIITFMTINMMFCCG